MATATLEISFERSRQVCRIFIRDGLLEDFPCQDFSGASSFGIISDDNVSKFYGDAIQKRISKFAPSHLITFPHGEKNKSLATVSEVCSKMSKLGLDRRSIVVALGGGVVGDLAGFAASIFKRGLKFLQVPTTLLAQVDSSIGGKTGVDTRWGKNQLGTFYEPLAVIIDPLTLDTLPAGEVINGLGEIIKSGIIADRSLFDKLGKRIRGANDVTVQDMKPLIKDACRIKVEVVQKDEREKNIRSILNYGHTVGHAIEASSNYRLSHGKSVLLGMICEGWISEKLGIFQKADREEQDELLWGIKKKYRLTTGFDIRKVLAFAFLDKKTSGGSIRMSLPEKIGKMHRAGDGSYTEPVSKDLFLASLKQLRRDID